MGTVTAMNGVGQIQEQLDSHRERLLEAIAPLPDEALLEPGAVGEWSVTNLLAVLTAWEAELVTGLMRLDQGKKPAKLLAALAEPDAYSARARAENEGRDLDRIFDDFQRVRRQLEDWLEEFSDRDLTDPKRYAWLGGKPLGQIIADITYKNEAKYVPALKEFARQRPNI